MASFFSWPHGVMLWAKRGKLCFGSRSTEGKEKNLWPSFQRNPLVLNVATPDSIGGDVGQ